MIYRSRISFLPKAVNQTAITVTSLIPATADLNNRQEGDHWQKNHDITQRTLDEDWELGVGIQRSLEQGGIQALQFGHNEWALTAFNHLVDQLLD